MAQIADLPTQYRPYFKAINKGIQRMIDIVHATETETLTKARKIELISEVNGLIESNIGSIEYFVKTGSADAELLMDTVLAKPIS